MELYLIIPAHPHSTHAVESVGGYDWQLAGPFEVINLPAYHCISYTWGESRVENLFNRGGLASSRTGAALEAAIRCNQSSEHQAYWLDAVCVPLSDPGRRSTLESMGFIYSQAKSVITVFDSATMDIIAHSARSRSPLSDSEMSILDLDKWANRVWTYQEIVNADRIFFTAYNLEEPYKVFGQDFLDLVGFSLQKWRQRHAASGLQTHQAFRGLNAIEDACADWQVAGYTERSFLTCLTGVEGRDFDVKTPASRLHALLGALTTETSWGSSDESISVLAERTTQLCNRQGDFSYVYTSDDRAGQSGLPKWKPDPKGGLVPIMKWHCHGASQPGNLLEHSLELFEMIQLDLTIGPGSKTVRQIHEWLQDLFEPLSMVRPDN